MKILVFDDNELHRKAAVNQLGAEYELTVVGTYDEAKKALSIYVDEKRSKEILARTGHKYPSKESTDEERVAYWNASRKADEEAIVYPNFDVVLTDLLVPASDNAQGPEGRRYVGQEMPMGGFIAFLAIKAGIKKIGVVTDLNHHNHPASAALDPLGVPFSAGDIRLVFSNHDMGSANPETLALLTDEEENKISSADYKRYPRVKNWRSVVRKLTEVE